MKLANVAQIKLNKIRASFIPTRMALENVAQAKSNQII
jgi:hypothetical protein